MKKATCPAWRPGQTVILDNLAVHENDEVRARIEAAGCHLLFLPALQPGLQSHREHAFARLKDFPRKAWARTPQTLEAAIAAGLATVTAQDACGWFKHCELPLDTQPF